MTDIRVVMVELGKLTERIDNLIERVGELKDGGKETRDKVAEVEKSIASFEGSVKVFGRIYALALVVVAALLAWFLKPVPSPISTTGANSAFQAAAQTNGAAEAAPKALQGNPQAGGSGR